MYTGPDPKSINVNFPSHTYELITCLVNGEQKRIIQDRYLQKFGYTKETYIIKFPLSPLKSLAASDSYRKAALSDTGRATRSNTITNLNLHNVEFQEKRQESCKKFFESDRSSDYRKLNSDRAKEQHKNGQADYVRLYYRERHKGSDAQKAASDRAKLNNPGNAPGAREKMRATYIKNSELGLHNKETKFKKKKFEDTNLIYQSSYELDFLELCKANNILHRIKNAPCLSADYYPYNFYAPDYILDDTYIIEIKSWYIENLQEKKCPGLLKLKEQLVIDKGYKFLYIKDKEYSVLENLIEQ